MAIVKISLYQKRTVFLVTSEILLIVRMMKNWRNKLFLNSVEESIEEHQLFLKIILPVAKYLHSCGKTCYRIWKYFKTAMGSFLRIHCNKGHTMSGIPRTRMLFPHTAVFTGKQLYISKLPIQHQALDLIHFRTLLLCTEVITFYPAHFLNHSKYQ